MERKVRKQYRDVGRLLIMLVSLAGFTTGIVLAFTHAWWWSMVGTAWILIGVSVQPKEVPPGVAGRWDLPVGITQAVAAAAVPLGIAAAVEWAWWWSLAAVSVLIGGAVLANELDKPKDWSGYVRGC